MAILAAGVGFALRGGIFGAWASEYGFTASQLGAIGGAGFSGFCFGIIIGGVIVDKIGYGKLIAVALLGVVVAIITGAAGGIGAATAALFRAQGAVVIAAIATGLGFLWQEYITLRFAQNSYLGAVTIAGQMELNKQVLSDRERRGIAPGCARPRRVRRRAAGRSTSRWRAAGPGRRRPPRRSRR